MSFVDLRILAGLHKPFHRNKDFSSFISQYHSEKILGETEDEHAKNGTHLLQSIVSEFTEDDTISELESELIEVLMRMEVT